MVELIDKENVPRYIFIEMNLSLGHNLKPLLSYEKNIFFNSWQITPASTWTNTIRGKHPLFQEDPFLSWKQLIITRLFLLTKWRNR